MSIGEAVGTALVQEVDVFDEQAEEGNDDLEGTRCGSALASSHLPQGPHMHQRERLPGHSWLVLALALGCTGYRLLSVPHGARLFPPRPCQVPVLTELLLYTVPFGSMVGLGGSPNAP